MLNNETKILADLKLSEAKLYQFQTYGKSFNIKGIFFLLISIMGSSSQNYQIKRNLSNRNNVDLTEDNRYCAKKIKCASEFVNARKIPLDFYLISYGFGRSDASHNLTDYQISLKNKFLLSVYDFNRKLKNNDLSLVNIAQSDVVSLHSQSFFKVLKSLYNSKNDHILIDLFNNQEFEDEILSRITLEDILMTISLEKFIAVPEHFESHLRDALSMVNQTLKYPLSHSELESLRKIILVYPSTSSFSNQARQLKEFGKNVYKTLNNFFELKCRILKLKHRIPLHEELCDKIIYNFNTPEELERMNSVSITIEDQSEDFKVQALSIDIRRYNSALEIFSFANELLDLSHLKNLTVKIAAYLRFPLNVGEIGSTLCSIIKKASKLEDLSLDSGSSPLMNEISSNLANILENQDNLHSLSLLSPVVSSEKFNRILLALKDKPIIRRLEIANCSFNLSAINESIDQSILETLSSLCGKVEKLVLSENFLCVESAELIAKALSCNTSNNITNIGTNQFLQPDNQKECFGLKKLVFSDFRSLNLDIAMIFLEQFKSLEDIEISFDSSFANQELCERLFNYLKTHSNSPNFRVLDSYYCDNLNFSTILKFKHRDHFLDLEELNLTTENFEKYLPEINFEAFKHVKRLSLKSVVVPIAFITTLLDGLKSSSIEDLDLSSNAFLFKHISSSIYSKLAQLVSDLPNLHSLDLSNNVDNSQSDDVIDHFKNFLLKVVHGRAFNYLNISFNSLELVGKTSINFYLNLFSSLKSADDLRFDLVLSGVDIECLWPVLETISSCDKFKKVSLTVVFNSEYTLDECIILAKKISKMQNLSNLFLQHDDMIVLSKILEVISFSNNFQMLEEVFFLNYQKNNLPFESHLSIINSLKRMPYLKDIKIKNDQGLLIKIN